MPTRKNKSTDLRPQILAVKKIEKKVVKKQTTEKYDAFFLFKGNKFTKLARDYHHELQHLTTDLMLTNRKVQEAAFLCDNQINYLKKNSEHLIPTSQPVCFSDALYHIENFNFRITGYRDKIVQFINHALRIGFDEKAMGVISTIVSHGTIRDAYLDTEIKKFDKDKDFREALKDRVLMTHRRYYHAEVGYNSLMQPPVEGKINSEQLKLWKQNIKLKANRADRITLKILDMNDRVMQKINKYLEKHPIR